MFPILTTGMAWWLRNLSASAPTTLSGLGGWDPSHVVTLNKGQWKCHPLTSHTISDHSRMSLCSYLFFRSSTDAWTLTLARQDQICHCLIHDGEAERGDVIEPCGMMCPHRTPQEQQPPLGWGAMWLLVQNPSPRFLSPEGFLGCHQRETGNNIKGVIRAPWIRVLVLLFLWRVLVEIKPSVFRPRTSTLKYWLLLRTLRHIFIYIRALTASTKTELTEFLNFPPT